MAIFISTLESMLARIISIYLAPIKYLFIMGIKPLQSSDIQPCCLQYLYSYIHNWYFEGRLYFLNLILLAFGLPPIIVISFSHNLKAW